MQDQSKNIIDLFPPEDPNDTVAQMREMGTAPIQVERRSADRSAVAKSYDNFGEKSMNNTLWQPKANLVQSQKEPSNNGEILNAYQSTIDEDNHQEQLKQSVRQRQKSELIGEINDQERKRACCSSCKTVTQYLCREMTKKPSAFKIGVFTVFLVVMVITMLKSVVDSAPVLFVKLGQDEVGAIDFTIRTGYSSLTKMPVNYYNMNPFDLNNPFRDPRVRQNMIVTRQISSPQAQTMENAPNEEHFSKTVLPEEPNPDKILLTESQKTDSTSEHVLQTSDEAIEEATVQIMDFNAEPDDEDDDPYMIKCEASDLDGIYEKCDDHLILDSGAYWMVGSYFTERLANLEGFSGFFPRIYLPSTDMHNPEYEEVTAHQTWALIDTKKEIEVGVGYDWKPVQLGANEIQISDQMALYLNVTAGDRVTLTFSSSDQSNRQMLRDIGKKFLKATSEGQSETQVLTLSEQDDQVNGIIDELGLITLEFTIAEPYEDVGGKFSKVLGNVAIADCNFVQDQLFDAIEVAIADAFLPLHRFKYNQYMRVLNEYRDAFEENGLTACDFPFEIDGVLDDQASYYLSSDYMVIFKDVGDQGIRIGEEITWASFSSLTDPLREQFESSNQTQAFLNATLLTVIVFLAILSTMLLYSLMLSDVDDRTYEYGMLRALGFKKSHLVRVICLKSASFSIPGVFFGVLVAFILNIGLRMLIFIEAQNFEAYTLTNLAICIGVAFGLIMPLISNYFPIQSAMGKNLRNSLDLNRRAKDEVGVRVERLENAGVSFNQLMVSLILIIVGFSCYYLVPWSIYKQKYTLLFMLLNIVLILVIIGMTFMCMLMFEYLERFLLWICIHTCCFSDRRLHQVIKKNMQAHRPRNSKTSLMFTLAISFLIFSASSFKLMSSLVVKTAEAIIGSDIRVTNPDGFINEIPMAEFLNSQMADDDNSDDSSKPVLDYAFTSISASDFEGYFEGIWDQDDDNDFSVMTAAGANSIQTSFYAVPENYLYVADSTFYIPTDVQKVSGVNNLPNGKIDIVGALYSEEDFEQYPTYPGFDQDAYAISISSTGTFDDSHPTATIPIILSAGIQGYTGIESGDIIRLNMPYDNSVAVRAVVRGLVTKFPGFTFSGLNTVQFYNQALISTDSFIGYMDQVFATNSTASEEFDQVTAGFQFYDNLPKKSLFVKLREGISAQQRDFVTNGIRNYFKDQTTYMLVKNDVVESFDSVQEIFNIFVALVATISLFMSFFLLLLASTQNVNDAIWEYGVLRSMGLTKGEGLRIFIYEAYIVVISAAMLGTIVGFVTAAAVAVQFYSFIEMPISLDFPWVLFGSMIGLSLVTVMVSVCAPVSAVNRRQVASVLKGLS